MASSEHVASSDFIKTVHQQLRNEAKILGSEKAWQKHCENEDNLKRYASEMHNLATHHWERNFDHSKAASRVDWTFEFCKLYFIDEEILKYRQKETEIAYKIGMEVPSVNAHVSGKRYRLLDVGSCYNPFKKYASLDVLPIDIAPATSDVYKCDFLNLKILSSACSVSNSKIISELQADTFDIIVFSLLLEYLPSPRQRLLCCEKAYNLLKIEGILIIITPDSKHVGANAKFMKSWRFILAKLGFSRIRYEKLAFLHCMVFRKSLRSEITQRWAMLQNEENFYTEFVIPQDFKKNEHPVTPVDNNSHCDSGLFEELPNFVE